MGKIMTHIVAGYPSMKECEERAITMAECGVSYIEVQFPFSDPIADGEVIMAANEKALDMGVTVRDCFELVGRLRERCEAFEVPVLIMTYFNIVFNYGVKEFCRRAAEYGVYGLIVPDLPYDEGAEFLSVCRAEGLHAIQVISPITPADRLRRIGEIASGFVYCVGNLGTTGARKSLDAGYLDRVRRYIDVPLAVGFGISDRSMVREAWKYADIAVIGSRLMNMDGKEVKGFLEGVLG